MPTLSSEFDIAEERRALRLSDRRIAAERLDRLPNPNTSFVGRTAELARLREMLSDPACRLLTLTGPGGVGKTRLAIEVARQARSLFADGATFVDLLPVPAADLVAGAIAEAAGLRLQGQRSPREQLIRFLVDGRRLIVLDNIEHLAEAADLLAEIVAEASGVTLLVTSRDAIGLDGWVYQVEPLPLTDVPGDGAGNPAMELFIDRAQRTRYDFDAQAERTAIADVCRIVGGMPLAIELAATWVRALTCEQIASEIKRNIDFLSSDRRDLPERHRSTTAVFDYSWQRLSEAERAVFARLSVFHGGFTQEAAERVAGARVRNLLTLVQRSLLRFRGADLYDLHALVRQYGEAKLAESGGLAAGRAAHGAWFLDLLGGALPGLAGVDQSGTIARLEGDFDNIRAAWRWAVEERTLAGRAPAIQALGVFLRTRGRYTEGADACRAAIASLEAERLDPDQAAALATALSQAGWFELRLGQFDQSWRAFRQAAALIREHDLPYLDSQQSDPVLGLALFAYGRGDLHRCEELASGVLERAVAAGRRANQYAALALLGRVARYEGDYDRALDHHVRAHELALQAGDGWYRTQILYELGMTASAAGARAESRRYLEASLTTFDDPIHVTNAIHGLAMLDLAEGKTEEAAHGYSEVLTRYREMRDEVGTIDALHGLSRAMIRLGDPGAGARHIGEGLKLASVTGMGPLNTTLLVDAAELFLAIGRPHRAAELVGLAQTLPTWASRKHGDIERNLHALERHFSPDELTDALRAGRALTLSDAITETLAELAAAESYRPAPTPPAENLGGDRAPETPAGSGVPSTTPIRVLLVDSHEIVRAGLVRLLAGAGVAEVVGEAGSGGEALALAADLQPDVVLLDLLLLDLDGVEVARRLLATHPAAHVLVLTSAGDHTRVHDAIHAGVTGYLLKDVRRDALLRAIEDAAAGRPALHPDVQRYLMQQSVAPVRPSPLASLTSRERDLMRFLARGSSNREIAQALTLTHGTVKVYVSALLDKLGVSDRTQAALIAARYAWDEP